ncbi:hypothetical protein F2Q69_00007467 [Brassica cretica]|uniref:Uncharacterized protein n=1 Tax=Brassica cretica TaxID=69181 RepID=A0A8S9PRF6_BRACR|nr:hypothetical protein F2Q69_00007467 [Brassica cretica]
MWVLDLEAFLSPEFFLRTRNISFKGPYSAILDEATIARRLCFAIWMSAPAGGFLFLAAVPGSTPWSGPVLWVLWTHMSLSSWEVDFMPVCLARRPSLRCWVLLLPWVRGP